MLYLRRVNEVTPALVDRSKGLRMAFKGRRFHPILNYDSYPALAVAAMVLQRTRFRVLGRPVQARECPKRREN